MLWGGMGSELGEPTRCAMELQVTSAEGGVSFAGWRVLLTQFVRDPATCLPHSLIAAGGFVFERGGSSQAR
jgi:hypothetical protein